MKLENKKVHKFNDVVRSSTQLKGPTPSQSIAHLALRAHKQAIQLGAPVISGSCATTMGAAIAALPMRFRPTLIYFVTGLVGVTIILEVYASELSTKFLCFEDGSLGFLGCEGSFDVHTFKFKKIE